MIITHDSGNASRVSPTSAELIADGLRTIVGAEPDPNRVLEIRLLGVEIIDWDGERTAVVSGTYYASEIDIAARDLLKYDGECRGAYVTINPISTGRFACSKSYNRLRESRRTHKDSDILYRDHLMIDVDPVRAAGHEKNPATDGERAEAWKVAIAIVDDLASRGWPTPAIVSTGSGFQLLYRTEQLPTNSDLVHRTLTALSTRHANESAKVDVAVANPSRIVRLPGLLNRKGTASPGRPHRRAELLQTGDDRRVTAAQIEAEAASVPPVPVRTAPSAETFLRMLPDDAFIRGRVYPYLDACKAAESGKGGRGVAFGIAGSLHYGFLLTKQQTFDAMIGSGWNARCSPPWTDGELWERIERAAKESRVLPGSLLDNQYQDRPRIDLSNFDELFGPEKPTAKAVDPEGSKGSVCDVEDPPELLVEAEPEEPAAAVAVEILASLKPTHHCQQSRLMIVCRKSTGRRGNVPFGCHRSSCSVCGQQKRRDLFASTVPYLQRQITPNRSVVLIGAVVPNEQVKTVRRKIRESNGEYLAVPTADADGCQLLGSVTLRHGEAGSTCLIVTGTLVLGVVPADAPQPEGFVPVTLTRAFRAIEHAFRTPPPRSEDAQRTRIHSKSHGWGDEPDRPAGDLVVEGPSIFSQDETRSIIEELQVRIPMWVADASIQGTPDGWNLPKAQSLALSLLLRGAGAPRTPSRDRVLVLAREWIRVIPANMGDGQHVETAIRRDLWYGARISTVEELHEAAARDRHETAAIHESRAYLRQLHVDLTNDLLESNRTGVADLLPRQIVNQITREFSSWGSRA